MGIIDVPILRKYYIKNMEYQSYHIA